MDTQNFCNSNFFKACITIIAVGMIFQIFEAGYYFGKWIYGFNH
jgi:hypothetical protein